MSSHIMKQIPGGESGIRTPPPPLNEQYATYYTITLISATLFKSLYRTLLEQSVHCGNLFVDLYSLLYSAFNYQIVE